MWDHGMWAYLMGEHQTVSVVLRWRKLKLFWCRKLWGSCWPHRGVTGAAGCHARMRPGSKSPFIFSILSQSVNSLFCVNEHLVCSSPACYPVTVQWFSGSDWCTCPDKARWGSLRGFPIKAVHSHRDQGFWLSLKEEHFKYNKWIIGTFFAEYSDFWIENVLL